jgi:hypothetical protein
MLRAAGAQMVTAHHLSDLPQLSQLQESGNPPQATEACPVVLPCGLGLTQPACSPRGCEIRNGVGGGSWPLPKVLQVKSLNAF